MIIHHFDSHTSRKVIGQGAMVEIYSAHDSLKLSQVRLLQSLGPRFLGGHAAVRKSLLLGFRANNIDFSVNPAIQSSVNTRLGVLAGRALARELIRKKANLALGPNYVVTPKDDPAVFSSAYVSAVVVPSPWVASYYSEEMPEIESKVRIWPVGVDTDFWHQGAITSGSRNVLLYVKIPDIELEQSIHALLTRLGFYVRVVRYGKYQTKQYREILSRSNFLVWLGGSESQGIAQFEAWSANIPTLIWLDPRRPYRSIESGEYDAATELWSPSPYLSKTTGAFFSDPDQLAQLCEDITSGNLRFSPRTFVLANYSSAVGARKYLDILRGDV